MLLNKVTFNAVTLSKLFKGSIIFSRCYGRIDAKTLGPPPPSFRDVVLPEQRRLPVMQKIPLYYVNQKPPRLRAAHNDIRGPELVNNKLFHNQYGIIALSGGYLQFVHYEIIRNGIIREMDTRKTFAIWRVDPLWKPVPKKSIGKRMGGGKGSLHHYSTPVKAGRIIIEVGGKVEYEEVFPYLNRIAKKMPFDAMPVSKELLQEIEEEAKMLQRKNINPFSFEYAIKNNLQDCNQWTGPFDKLHYGKYI